MEYASVARCDIVENLKKSDAIFMFPVVMRHQRGSYYFVSGLC